MHKKIDLWNDHDRFLPPGLTNSKMLQTLLMAVFFVLFRILFDYRELAYSIERASQGVEKGWHIQPPHNGYDIYPTFNSIMKISMLLFFLMAIVMLSHSINHYLYYYQGSKSIYVMRRVRDRWLVAKQCCAVPLFYALCILFFAAVYYGLFCAAYFYFAPEGVIPEQTIAFFWRYVP